MLFLIASPFMASPKHGKKLRNEYVKFRLIERDAGLNSAVGSWKAANALSRLSSVWTPVWPEMVVTAGVWSLMLLTPSHLPHHLSHNYRVYRTT